MKRRLLGKTGFEVSEISLGTWQVGGKWGESFDHKNAQEILNTAVDHGVNFIDTADVYGDGQSERALGKLVRSRKERIYVATKCGRRLSPHIDSSYTPAILRKSVEDSLKNMDLERIDLIQLHCPPPETYNRPEIFGEFKELRKEGKILNLGVSVERVEEAMRAMEYTNVTTIQIIFNMFRQRPAEKFFAAAAKKNIGIIVRVPLASGLLTGKFNLETSFGNEDHRHFNRNGKAFDKGETFSGIDYGKGLEAVEELRKVFPQNDSLALVALRWILMFREVSCIIPGASRSDQVLSNLRAAELPALKKAEMDAVLAIYKRIIWPDLSKEKW
jgi:aryl-alcohol dehydrogenase-like predicted oxidoreductase